MIGKLSFYSDDGKALASYSFNPMAYLTVNWAVPLVEGTMAVYGFELRCNAAFLKIVIPDPQVEIDEPEPLLVRSSCDTTTNG